jgi:hypothetical protein
LLNIASSSGQSELYVSNNGNVGIGTTSPAQKLQIGSNSSGGNVLVPNGWLCVGNGSSGTTNGACSSASTTAAGTIYANALTIQQGDYAEKYLSTDSNIAAGTVVALDGQNSGYITTASGTATVIGVVSTAPGITIGDSTTNNPPGGTKAYPIALSGRVPVNVTNENGNIKAGDYITVSTQFYGYAAKAVYSGNIIGIALQDFTSITPGASGQILVFVQPRYQNINNTFVLEDQPVQLPGQVGQLPSSSPSSFIIDQKGSGNILQLQKDGMDKFIIANDGSVQILGNATSAVQTLLVVKNGPNTLFSIDSVGNAQFAGHITVGSDTAGTAIIKAGDNKTSVTFNSSYASIPKIIATPDGTPVAFAVTDKSTTGFSIVLNQPAAADISFDWFVIQQPTDTASVSALVVVNGNNNNPPANAGTSGNNQGQILGDSTTTPNTNASTTPATGDGTSPQQTDNSGTGLPSAEVVAPLSPSQSDNSSAQGQTVGGTAPEQSDNDGTGTSNSGTGAADSSSGSSAQPTTPTIPPSTPPVSDSSGGATTP